MLLASILHRCWKRCNICTVKVCFFPPFYCHVFFLILLGVAHRDLKPENILLQDPTHKVIKLTDFGLSRFVDSESFMKTFCGTPNYVGIIAANSRLNLFIYLLFIYLFIYLFIIYLFNLLIIYIYISQFIHSQLFTHFFIHLFILSFIYLFIYLFIYFCMMNLFIRSSVRFLICSSWNIACDEISGLWIGMWSVELGRYLIRHVCSFFVE
jgi:hypothetical protein